MANLGAFDASGVEPNTPFQIIPAGKYKAQIVNSEMRATKNGAGQFLWLEMEILEGEHQGQKLWDRLNLVNSNAQAVEIAQRTLSAICHAVKKLQVTDSEHLHLIPFTVNVKVKPRQDNGEPSNEIGGYSAADGSRPATTTAASRPAAGTAPAAAAPPAAAAKPVGNTPPWRNRPAA